MEIRISKIAKKQLLKVPFYIKDKFEFWCDLITTIGLREARKFKGYHDEPLSGDRHGQRSIRLSKGYRAIYIEIDNKFEIIEILEVNKHEY